MRTESKLKPCPFCGYKNIFHPTAIPHKVHCYNCECYGPWYDRMGRKWNSIPRRSEVLELVRLVDECQKTETQQFHNALFMKVWNYVQKLKNNMKS